MPLQTVITKEYPPEMADQRVGWVSVEQMDKNPDLVGVNVVVATVGQEGARYGYHLRDDDPTRMYSSRSDEGFLTVSGLFMFITKDGVAMKRDGIYYRAAEHDDESETILLNGGSGYHDFVPREEDKQWVNSSAEMLNVITEGLDRFNIGQAYPDVYYTLNGGIGQTNTDSNRGKPKLRVDQLMIPDPEMQEQTLQQVGFAGDIATKLLSVQADDELMKRRLTIFSDVPAANIAETFVESRRKVAVTEKEIKGVVDSLVVPRLVYLPIGFRPNGRSWPYMDAEAKDEAHAFGSELSGLKQKNTESADYQLKLELKELVHRLAYAQNGRLVLRLLAESERTAVRE